MSTQEEPTPVTGVGRMRADELERAEDLERRSEAVLARHASSRLAAADAPTPKSVREERMAALVARLDAAFTELAAVRADLLSLGGRVGGGEARITALEGAVRRIEGVLTALDAHVVGIGAQVGRINMALLKLGALTVVGGAIANALMHTIGLQ